MRVVYHQELKGRLYIPISYVPTLPLVIWSNLYPGLSIAVNIGRRRACEPLIFVRSVVSF